MFTQKDKSVSSSCEKIIVHDDIVKKVENILPQEEKLYDLADFFKVFGDTTRIKILQALRISEMCVCDLAYTLKTSQSAMSHQLKTLRQANLVKFRKEGKTTFYSLKDHHVDIILDTGLEHIEEL